jgi:hypothetical protein
MRQRLTAGRAILLIIGVLLLAFLVVLLLTLAVDSGSGS